MQRSPRGGDLIGKSISTPIRVEMAGHPVGGLGFEHLASIMGDMIGALDQYQHHRARDLVTGLFGVLVAGDAVFPAADDEHRTRNTPGDALEIESPGFLARLGDRG